MFLMFNDVHIEFNSIFPHIEINNIYIEINSIFLNRNI